MATGQRPRTDAGNRDTLDPEGEYALAERPGTKRAIQGALARCYELVEQGRWEQAVEVWSTVGAFLETVTDPMGVRAKTRAAAGKDET